MVGLVLDGEKIKGQGCKGMEMSDVCRWEKGGVGGKKKKKKPRLLLTRETNGRASKLFVLVGT